MTQLGRTGGGLPRRRFLALAAGGLGAGALAGCSGPDAVRYLPAAAPLPPGAGTVPDPAPGAPRFDVRAAGAAGDGRTDDSVAIRAALDAANRVAGTVLFPPGRYRFRAGAPLVVNTGVSLVGTARASVVELDRPDRAAGGDDFATFLVTEGDRVAVIGLTVRRVADFPCVMVRVGPYAGLALRNVQLHGDQRRLPGQYCHGLELGTSDTGTTLGVELTGCTVGTMSYGLFQTNDSRATVTKIRVRGCAFVDNVASGLEFNSPNGLIRDVQVSDTHFTGSKQGFGVGVAHCGDVVLHGNTFHNFPLEAVHIEDYSENVLIEANTFTSCGQRENSCVQVIGGARRVRIMGNTFSTAPDTPPITCVNVLQGGELPTPGGRPAAPPSQVTVAGNRFEYRTPVRAISLERVDGGTVEHNDVVRTDAPGQPGRPDINVVGGSGLVVRDNQLNGRRI